jgi:hypothetical protein
VSRTTDLAECIGLALGVPTILSHQVIAGAPRPADVYATVRMLNAPRAGAAPHRTMVKGSGVKTISNLRLGAALVDVYGPGAFDLADSLQEKLARLDVSSLARSKSLNLQPLGPTLEAPQLRDTTHEEHAQAEIRVQYVGIDEEAREVIDTVEVGIDVKTDESTVLETIEVTATTP